jgi:hypothetical protein
MNKLLLAGATALAMTAGAAMAQTTTTSETTTSVAPMIVMPTTSSSSSEIMTTVTPIEVMPTVGSGKFPTPDDAVQHEAPVSVTRTERTIGADGSETDSTQTITPNSNGVADDSVTRSTTYPATQPPAITTTTTKSWSSTTE